MKLINKRRITPGWYRGVLAVMLLSVIPGLAAYGTDTDSNSDALDSFGTQEDSVSPESSFTPESSTTPGNIAGRQTENESKRQLTEGELRDSEEYLNRTDNYGFLMSDYQSPEYINLNEVFYSGAGLERSPLTEEERDMYLKTVGQPELYTDLARLSTEQMNGFLTEKTGPSFDRMKSGLEWIYLAPFDRYYSEHGDTNVRSFFCPGGEVDRGVYRIRCLSDGYSQFNLESIVTLKKVSSEYQFLSNEIIWDYLGAYKENARSPAAEALHYIISAYKKEVEEGGIDIYPVGEVPGDYDAPASDSDARYYSIEEMRQINWRSKLIAVFRNEVYARHGYIFKNDFWNDSFSTSTWYSGEYPADAFSPGVFNEYEKANLKLTVGMEK